MFSNLEEIQAVAAGEHIQPVVEEEAQPQPEGDDVNDSMEIEEEAGEIEAEEIEVAEAQPEEGKKRSSMIPRDRFDQVNERAKEYETKAQQAEWRIQQLEQALEKAVGIGADEPAIEEDEVLDTALEGKVNKEIGALKQQQLNMALNNEYNVAQSKHEGFNNAFDWVVAAEATSKLQNAQLLGRPMTEKQALEAAEGEIMGAMAQVYTENPRTGIVGDFVMSYANRYGFSHKAGQKAQNGVNMKALDKVRREAGAPAVQKESVKAGGGTVDWKQKLKAKNKADGVSEKVTNQFFG